MEEFKVGDLVVPLYEDKIEVFRVSKVGGALEVVIEHGWQIGNKSTYRKATQEEIDALYVPLPNP